MQYKTVAGPMVLVSSGKNPEQEVVQKYAALIDKEAVGGWELDMIQQVAVERRAGCLAALFGAKSTITNYNMLIFKKAV